MRVATLALIFALGGLPACALIGPDDVDMDLAERTYPEAFDLKLVTLDQLLNEVPAPGAYNVEVYVVAVQACPEGWNCDIADHLFIAEQRDPPNVAQGIMLFVEAPRQFRERGRYRFSLRVEDLDTEGAPFRRPILLGYSRVD